MRGDDKKDPVESIRSQFAEAGLQFARPWLNAGSIDCCELPGAIPSPPAPSPLVHPRSRLPTRSVRGSVVTLSGPATPATGSTGRVRNSAPAGLRFIEHSGRVSSTRVAASVCTTARPGSPCFSPAFISRPASHCTARRRWVRRTRFPRGSVSSMASRMSDSTPAGPVRPGLSPKSDRVLATRI
jgi:hypothetical protein